MPAQGCALLLPVASCLGATIQSSESQSSPCNHPHAIEIQFKTVSRKVRGNRLYVAVWPNVCDGGRTGPLQGSTFNVQRSIFNIHYFTGLDARVISPPEPLCFVLRRQLPIAELPSVHHKAASLVLQYSVRNSANQVVRICDRLSSNGPVHRSIMPL